MVWSAFIKQSIGEKSLWDHINKYVPPGLERTTTAAIIAVPAASGSDAVAGVPATTKAMVDLEMKEIANF